MSPRVQPFGSWSSPLSASLLASSALRLKDVRTSGDSVYWWEGRPAEGGRGAIVSVGSDGAPRDLVPAPFNARTLVHEYGGAPYVLAGDTLYFSNYQDQRLYRVSKDGTPEPISDESGWRFADAIVDSKQRLLIAVGELHGNSAEPENCLVALPTEGQHAPAVIARGHDFYSSPRLSSDGTKLAWLTWDHPRMPWEGTELWVAAWGAGRLGEPRKIAGGPREAICQPEWGTDGSLYFISDRTGWWNLYREHDGRVDALAPRDAEFARPHWVFGQSSYAIVDTKTIVAAYTQQGLWHLGKLDLDTKAWTPIPLDYTEIENVRATKNGVAFLGGSANRPLSVVRVDRQGKPSVLRRATELPLEASYLSTPEPLEFPTENGRTSHALFYRPRNPEFKAPEGELPPLLVVSHGGPTGSTSSALDLGIQYWTTRGFAVLDVNYGGSTGYGREYRERLFGHWGVVDVDDCANGARYLSARREVDARRLAIRGGSAGGFTTLAALTFRDVFHAGASHYGVSDLEALEAATHKFESRYNHSLIGPYPEMKALYRERSPIHFVDKIKCPVILLQGLEDKVVPPEQSEKVFAALKAKGIPVAYLPFPGEQHGFRKRENIERAFEAELYFYGKIFGFAPADRIAPVDICHFSGG